MSFQILKTVIDDRHLDDAAIALARKKLNQTSNRFAIFDNFLRAEHLPKLRKLALEEGSFEPNLKLKPNASVFDKSNEKLRRSIVDENLFNRASENERFISQSIFTGPRDEHAHSGGAKIDRLFRNVMRQPQMHEFLGRISGYEIEQTGSINLKTHERGHYLKKHNDAKGGRKLCAVLYLHEHWAPNYGGRFSLYMHDGSKKFFDPLPNRMILFDVSVDNDHEIEVLRDSPESWKRINYSFWFH